MVPVVPCVSRRRWITSSKLSACARSACFDISCVLARCPKIPAPAASGFHLYTVIMYDPDAPSPDSPICKVCRWQNSRSSQRLLQLTRKYSFSQDWVHWIYTDASGKHLTGGKQLLPYNGPTPPEGIHSYHISLYSQPAELSNAVAPNSRYTKTNVT